MPDITALRRAILAALPAETSRSGGVPDTAHLYVPPAHTKALRLDCQLVIGARGVGKSVWTAALGDSTLRHALGSSVPGLETTEVRIGFSETERIDDYPDADTYGQLRAHENTPYHVWRAVMVRWLAGLTGADVPEDSWRETVAWVRNNPEQVARVLEQASQRFVDAGRHGLIVFDALDRSSDDWRVMDEIVRDLLRTALWLKSLPKLSAKVFLRGDQFDRTVTDFPDASKLLATRVELTWEQHDLHGLLWQMLINGPGEHGECLRAVYTEVVTNPPLEVDGHWRLANDVKRETPTQRALFEALAGPWMGRDRRRGVPYVWSVSHLADGRGRTSPRSFLAAIRQAAEDSQERYPEHGRALHYESIKRGIQKASEIRVNEMAEDYPWVPTVLRPLNGLTVPCDFELVLQCWQEAFPGGVASVPTERLPPQHADRGWEGLRDDLQRLGLFDLKKDGRIDMPDLYRVGFGLGRRGGVRPRI